MNWYLQALQRYAEFSGRSRRKEFWFSTRFNFLVALGLGFIDLMMGTAPLLGALYFLGILIPSIAVTVRRLHDTGRSGWWILISLVPVIGALVLLVFVVLDSEPRANEYGPNPKEAMDVQTVGALA
jgi:uncharacterized membrane protein YhaH (DUF805 family)